MCCQSGCCEHFIINSIEAAYRLEISATNCSVKTEATPKLSASGLFPGSALSSILDSEAF